MRIIAGKAKGRRLATPKTKEIRPVLDQVKESIFNILFSIEGLEVLDVFAGTGSIGLEAVSRGAKRAVFVDKSREAVGIIKENIKRCRFEKETKIIPKDVRTALPKLAEKGDKFDLIFVDPPYLKDLVVQTINKIHRLELLTDSGTIITEHHPKEPIEGLVEGLTISDQRKYGQTTVTFVQHSE